jgi:nucleolar protein 56
MEITAWFGKVDLEAGSVVPAGDIKGIMSSLLDSQPCPEEQPDLRALAQTSGLFRDDREYNSRLRKLALALVRRQLLDLATEEQDLLQAVGALDNLHESVNLLDERLYEWSRLHRDEIVHGKDLALGLSQDATMGELARAILSLRESRKRLEDYVAEAASTMAPNLSALAGPLLAARLISRAGSLQRLAQLPSSAIQLMGAEKALFKHLEGRAPSPKHGIIYRHPAISTSPKRLRGKIARALAGKLALAARADFFGGVPVPELKQSLEKRLAEIRRSGKPKK